MPNWIYTHNLNPILIKLGPLEPRWYALMYLLGFAATYQLIARNPRFLSMGFNKDDAMDFLTYGFLGVILGGPVGLCALLQSAHVSTKALGNSDGLDRGHVFPRRADWFDCGDYALCPPQKDSHATHV
jgi:hypothetical protein